MLTGGGDRGEVGAPSPGKQVQVLVRVPPETYAALHLAITFEDRRSMQGLVRAILDEYILSLRRRNAGYDKALDGWAESQARDEGVLARRTATRRSQVAD
jgi:hypothetical protein